MQITIQRITIALIACQGYHPCVKISGARHRDYWFFKTGDGPYKRTYEGSEDTEERRNKGIFPITQAQADAADIFRGGEHKDRGVELTWNTAEECKAEADAYEARIAAEIEESNRRKAEIKRQEELAEKHREEMEVLSRHSSTRDAAEQRAMLAPPAPTAFVEPPAPAPENTEEPEETPKPEPAKPEQPSEPKPEPPPAPARKKKAVKLPE